MLVVGLKLYASRSKAEGVIRWVRLNGGIGFPINEHDEAYIRIVLEMRFTRTVELYQLGLVV